MTVASGLPQLVGQRREVLPTVDGPVVRTGSNVVGARGCSAANALEHLVRGKDRRRFVGASGLMLFAGQASRAVHATKVRRAVHSPIDGARGLMGSAHVSRAAGAPGHLVAPNRLVLPPLAEDDARPAQSPTSLWRRRRAHAHVGGADVAPADRTGDQARRTGLVITLGARAPSCPASTSSRIRPTRSLRGSARACAVAPSLRGGTTPQGAQCTT